MPKYLFDSSVILAIIFNEKGSSQAIKYLNNSAISSVNFAEVISKLVQKKADPAISRIQVANIIENIIPFDDDCAFLTGKLNDTTSGYGLSLGDRACIATAQKFKLEIVTADKVWSLLDIPTKVHVVR